MDEVMFQQHGSTCKMWIAPEDQEPVIYHHPTKKCIGYYGATRLYDGKFIYQREPDAFNAETCHRFLRYLHETTRNSNKKIIVIIDNARYHHAKLHKEWREACNDRFFLLFLPPYSPELNPIERIWKLTRRLCTHNQYFPTLDHIIASVEEQFSQWNEGNETLRRLCAIN